MVLSRYAACLATIILMGFNLNAMDDEEGFVIIEKPDEEVRYEIDDLQDNNLGEPVVSRWSSQIGLAYMKKQFTFVDEGTLPIDSTFKGAFYAYGWNGTVFSISSDIGIYVGGKDGTLDGEESNTGLQDSLKVQYIADLGLNLYLNSLSHWAMRPYIGGGVYVNAYEYLESDSSTKTDSFTLNSSFIRAGIAFDLGAIDREAAADIWRNSGIFRTSLIVEGKQYATVDSTSTSEFELYSALVFEY